MNHPMVMLLAGAIGVLAASPAVAEDDRLTRLLDLHLRWRGGREALGNLKDVTSVGVLKIAGLTGSIQVEQTVLGLSRTQYDLKVSARTEVVGPEQSFALNASGQVEPLTDAGIARRRFSILRTFGLHLGPRSDVRVSLLAEEEKDGRTWQVVRFERAGNTYDLLLDPRDGGSFWSREKQDAETVWTHLEDWREVAGVRFPHRQRTIRENKAQNSEIAWTEVRVNAGVAAQRFARPIEGQGLAVISGDGRSTGWMPMTLHLGRYIYLRGRLNGHETDIVLDSGAGATVVDSSFAERIGIKGTGSITATGVGGSQKASFAPDLRIEVGGVALEKVRGILIDMSKVGQRLGRDMPVILGKEVFQELVVDVDHPNSRIAFHASRPFAYQGPGSTLKLLAGEHGHRVVEASAEGLPKGRFTLDTGSGDTVIFFKTFSDRHRLLERRSPVSEREGAGVGGTVLFKVATIRSFSFAGFELREVPASFAVENKGALNSEELAGNLGVGILGRFRLVFDYSREQLHVEPGPDWATLPFRKNRLGLGVDFENGAARVSFVAPGSPAARAGWKAGDRITAVDGRKVDRGSVEEMSRLADVPPGTVVTFVDGEGKERRLVAADYY